MRHLKISQKLIRIVAGILGSALLFGLLMDPLLGVEIPSYIAYLLTGFASISLGALVYFFSPFLVKNLRIWFENLIAKAVRNAVTEFLRIQNQRIQKSKEEREKRDKKSKEEKLKKLANSHSVVLDTSAIIDGRILEVFKSGFLDGRVLVTQYVLDELQNIADSSDAVRRQKGRRGLDVLNEIKKTRGRDFKVLRVKATEAVDKELVHLCKKLGSRLVTVDFNLNKVAKVSGVTVLNVNDLANNLKTVVLPGETVAIKIIQKGKEGGQGVGYLDDGTMVVVEGGESFVGKDIPTTVSRIIQTSAGKMIFTKLPPHSQS